MAWVRFKQDYDYRVKHGVTTAYKAGMVLNVPSRCVHEALQLGRAERIKTPRKHELERVQNDGR